MQFDVVYLSPHADDVAFSAAAHLAREVADGACVALVTVFDSPQTASASSPFANAALRAAEDRRYAAVARVERLTFGLSEAIDRHPRYRAPWHLFAPLLADERATVERVRDRLEALVAAGCRRIVAPLGVGQHADHQIVHEAARATVGAEVRFYEDAPYVLMPYQLPRRLARLAVDLDPFVDDVTLARAATWRELGALARAWQQMPLIRAAAGPVGLPLALCALLRPELVHPPERCTSSSSRIAVAELCEIPATGYLKMEAIACYASQWPLFYPTLDAWRLALDRYGRAIGRRGVVERLWRLEETVPVRRAAPSAPPS